jgi:hypothetical protein
VLATANPSLVTAAVADLPQISLADALSVCLVLRGEPERYARATPRWHGRLCLEARGFTAGEAQLALSCLPALPTDAAEAAGGAIAEVCRTHDLSEAAAVLDRWAESHWLPRMVTRGIHKPCRTPTRI